MTDSQLESKTFYDNYFRGTKKEYLFETTGEISARIDNIIYIYLVGVVGRSYRIQYDPCGSNGLVWTNPESATYEDEKCVETNIYYGTIDTHPDDINKIMILGFPHSGTTILRAKMGDCQNAMEVTNEIFYIDPVLAANHKDLKVIGKSVTPTLQPCYRGSFNEKNIQTPYGDDKFCFDVNTVLLIKNPYQIFSSINKRFGGTIPEDKTFSFDYYEKFARLWLKYRNENEKRVTSLKYEEMFNNDFKVLRNLFNKLGLVYDADIFTGKKFDYSVEGAWLAGRADEYPDADPEKSPIYYRINQMNREFKDMSNPEAYKNIHPETLDKINNSQIVKELGYSANHTKDNED